MADRKEVEERLLVTDPEEMRDRIEGLLDGEGLPESILARPGGAYQTGHGPEYWREDELLDIARYLSGDHDGRSEDHTAREVMRESIRDNLEEIQGKAEEEIREHSTRYERSFWLGGYFKDLIDVTEESALYVTGMPVTKDTEPPEIHHVVHKAADGMLGYIDEHQERVEEFLEYLWQEKVSIPYALRGLYELESRNHAKLYFEIFELSGGEQEFMLDGIKRSWDPEYFLDRPISTLPYGTAQTYIEKMDEDTTQNFLEIVEERKGKILDKLKNDSDLSDRDKGRKTRLLHKYNNILESAE